MAGSPVVLVVDDDADFLEIVTARLKNKGLVVKTASDGIQAISMAKEIKPAVILMDVQMPNKNGIEAADEIMSDPGTKNTHIIFLTNLGDPAPTSMAMNKKFSQEFGAADYFKKSGDYEKLTVQVQELLNKPKV